MLKFNIDIVNTLTYNKWDEEIPDKVYERTSEITPEMQKSLDWLQEYADKLRDTDKVMLLNYMLC